MKKVLTHYLRPCYARMALGFVIKFTGTIFDLLLPWLLAYIIDDVAPTGDRRSIALCALAMVLCAFGALSFNVIANRMASAVARDTTRAIRHDLFARIMTLSAAQTDAATKPSLISRLTTDTYNINQMLGRVQRLGVRAPILTIGGILITLTLDPVLSMVLVAVLPVIVLLTIRISRVSIPLYHQVQQSSDQLVRLVREDAAGIRVIKALSKTDAERARFDAVSREVIAREKKASGMMARVGPLTSMLLNGAQIVVILVGALRVASGHCEVGRILAFMTYFTIILNAVVNLSKMFVVFSRAAASADRVMAVIDLPQDMLTLPAPDMPDMPDAPAIEFDGVSFSYGGSAEAALEDISFSLARGQTLGIIGETGSGKSTLIRLLMRFYDPTQGQVRLFGQDARTIPHEQLRAHFGAAFQSDTLFEDTIAENIRLGRPLTDAQITQAARDAQAYAFVQDDKQGFDTGLAIRGNNLSGGQKQRVMIARALCGRPDILVLDDASSALDYRTDAALRTALRERYAEVTKVLVAQRVSSVASADLILVLSGGRILARGTHETLLSSCAVYQELYASQMGGLDA
ncbi:MAG: ABC transporter ATP-binding protein [Clostridiales bacterium]|nr:ABC transporter ATP-binding protein [Clostridiales bacterium]MDY5349906.1 ABC transporter ATP-binding protein [Candidatus Ventricola sp.]MDY5514620.1 ABC transporter ATP-binding protein [Candidatus Ventricola sp.]